MGRLTTASLVHRRALNQALLRARDIPIPIRLKPVQFVRALRSALRMSQTHLARRSGVPQAHIARIEAGRLDPRLETLRRLYDAMFCDLVVLPQARRRLSEAYAERDMERAWGRGAWDERT